MTTRRRLAVSPRLIDATVTASLVALVLLQLTGRSVEAGQRPSGLLAYLLAMLMTLPFMVHRRSPAIALGVVLTAMAAYSVGHFVAYPGINAFVLLFAVALHSGRRTSFFGFLATLGVLAVSLSQQPGTVVTPSTWVSTLLALTVAWLTGENLRHRRARWSALEERAQFVEREREDRARQAVTEERLRIARELHDVVAHSMSVIAVQAGVGHHVIDSQPDEARRALAAIEATSRSALTEMRRLLGVLRQEGQSRAALEPSPGLADLPALVEQVGEAGLTAQVRLEGVPVDLPPGVDLSAYRIVQEALTNTIRHGGPSATVTICYEPDCVAIEVSDPGTPAPRGPAGTGHGIIGMRERVAVFGGQLTAGPRPGGGFRVAARLPLSAVQK